MLPTEAKASRPWPQSKRARAITTPRVARQARPAPRKSLVERPVEMALHILPCGLRGAMGELAVAQTVNDAYQRALGPLPDDKGIAVDLAAAGAVASRRRRPGAGPHAAAGAGGAICGKRCACPGRAAR